MKTRDYKKKLMEQVTVDPDGCWIWTGATNSADYGIMRVKNKLTLVHRLSHEFFKGEILNGLTIDHLCRVRKCINPSHLEAVTNKENILRGIGITAQESKQTHCKRGHKFTPKNTAVRRGKRCCRKCETIRSLAYRAKEKK